MFKKSKNKQYYRIDKEHDYEPLKEIVYEGLSDRYSRINSKHN